MKLTYWAESYRGGDGSFYRTARTGPNDTSRATHYWEYSGRCGHCELNQSHSIDCHEAEIAAADLAAAQPARDTEKGRAAPYGEIADPRNP